MIVNESVWILLRKLGWSKNTGTMHLGSRRRENATSVTVLSRPILPASLPKEILKVGGGICGQINLENSECETFCSHLIWFVFTMGLPSPRVCRPQDFPRTFGLDAILLGNQPFRMCVLMQGHTPGKMSKSVRQGLQQVQSTDTEHRLPAPTRHNGLRIDSDTSNPLWHWEGKHAYSFEKNTTFLLLKGRKRWRS